MKNEGIVWVLQLIVLILNVLRGLKDLFTSPHRPHKSKKR
jgi:hypothetical protein